MPGEMEEREGIEYICKLIYEAYRVPVMWLDAADTPRATLPPAFECRQAVQGAQSLLQEVMDIARRSSPAATAAGKAARTTAPPYLHTTGFLENLIILQLPEADRAGGAIVIGPVLSAPVTGDNAASLMRDYSIPPAQQDGWLQYYRSLPVLSRMRWYHAALLLYTLATGEALSITELLLAAGKSEQSVPQPDDSPDLNLSYRRENTWLHHDPMLEREMFRHIRNGDKAGLLRTQASFSEESYGRLSKKSQLRSKKSGRLLYYTGDTRSGEGGLFWEIAYTLSDFHIQHIEELHDIPAVDRAQLAALCDFADQVLGSRSSKLSRISALCQNYIYNHLYEEIPLSRLAEFTGLNASYLSQLFKKETGTAISDYIRQERIEEAKRLMGLPGITLSDIASRLHFNDQSYFTKVFKKYTGLTPGQYKQDSERFSRFT